MPSRATTHPVTVAKLRTRLREMSDRQLINFGKAKKVESKTKTSDSELAIQLREAQAEWHRRHPNKVKVTPAEFEKQASDAMLSHLLRRTVGIINEIRNIGTNPDGRRADEEVPSTGCPILWNKKRLILTAGHVIGSATVKDIRIMAPAPTALVFKEPAKLTLADMEVGQSPPSGSRILQCDWEDLAIIVLPDGSFPETEFVDIRAAWIEPSEGEMVHCCGFPSDHRVVIGRKMVSRHREEVDLGIYPTVFGAKIMGLPSDSERKFHITDFTSKRHYLIPYLSSTSKHPRGISGSATWWESDEEMLVWRPEFKFAGICVATYRKGTVVQVIKASVVLRFLREALRKSRKAS